MTSARGPWWSKTWWGKRHTVVNVTIVVIILLFMAWKSFFP